MAEQGKNIRVEISPSEMEAYVTVFPEVEGEEEPSVSFMEILAALRQAGITVGIDEAEIHTLISEKRWGERILVARGRPPVNGENGRVEYYFEINKKPTPKEDEEGRVDFREIGLLNLVEKDQLLAQRFPAKPGKSGATVKGRIIAARHGEEVFIKPGLNTYFSGDGDLKLHAIKTGSVSLVNGAVQVDDTLRLLSGVNFSTGNVEFPGDVVIFGDVESGFTVKSGGKVEIYGVVEDALVEADDDVLVKGGFVGSGRGMIRSRKDVYLRFVDNQTVETEGNVYIGNSCVQAKITALGDIEVSSGRGVVIGGHLRSGGNIRAKVFGNPQHTLTLVEIIEKENPMDEAIREKQEQIKRIEEKLLEVRNFVVKMQRLRAETDEHDPLLLDTIRRHQEQLHRLDEERRALKKEVNDLHLADDCQSNVEVLNRVYPGTRILIGESELIFTEESGRAVFKRVKGEIINLTAPPHPAEYELES